MDHKDKHDMEINIPKQIVNPHNRSNYSIQNNSTSWGVNCLKNAPMEGGIITVKMRDDLSGNPQRREEKQTGKHLTQREETVGFQ